MSSELAVIAPKDFTEAQSMAKILATSGLLNEAIRSKPQDVLLLMMTGAELGFGPAQSIRAIDVIKGKPSLKAETMVALVKSRKDVCEYLMLVHSDAKSATYETKRVGEPKPTTLTFTSADADTAGLTGDNWKKFRPAMLRARASAAICKAVYPDITLGLSSSEEVVDLPDATEEAKFEYTPSTAPRSSPPIDATFKAEPDPLESALTEFQSRLSSCISVPEMEALWKASPKGSAEQQARMTTLYKARKAELTAAPTAAPEESK